MTSTTSELVPLPTRVRSGDARGVSVVRESSAWRRRAAARFALALLLTACGARPETRPLAVAGGAAATPALRRHAKPPISEIPPPAHDAASCVVPAQRGVSASLEVSAFFVPADTAGLRCCAYLRRSRASSVARTKDERIVLFQNGTGIYTTAPGDLDGLARAAGKNGNFALLSVDKPGVGSTVAGITTLDREAFDRHTMADLVACATNAIDVSRRQPHVAEDASVLAHGHSEGAQVWVRALTAASERGDRAWAARVEANVLSGLPLEPVTTGAERQLGVFLPFEIEAFRRAATAHDDDYLVLLGMPWRYLEHPMARESTTAVMERLATLRPGARFELFHGERDVNAPITNVNALVASQAKAKREGRAALELRLHAYPGADHQLDARLDTDLDTFVASLGPRRREPGAE